MNKEEREKFFKEEAKRIFKHVEEVAEKCYSDKGIDPLVIKLAMIAVKELMKSVITDLSDVPNDVRIAILEGLLDFSYTTQRIVRDGDD